MLLPLCIEWVALAHAEPVEEEGLGPDGPHHRGGQGEEEGHPRQQQGQHLPLPPSVQYIGVLVIVMRKYSEKSTL